MTFLITGGSGFIGSAIAQNLARAGHQVIIPTRSINNCWRLEDQTNMTLLEGQLIDAKFQEQLFQKYKPQVVIHAAWEGMTRQTRNDPSQINNFIMTDTLMKLSGVYQCSLFIGFGSQAEYGVYNREIDEEMVAKPDNLYGVYKLAAGLLGKWYAQHNGFNYAWLRLFSSFGPRDWDEYFIPYNIRSFLKNEAPALSSCSQQWDYLYIDDLVSLVRKVIEKKGRFCDIYNLSSGVSTSFRELVDTIKILTKSTVEPQIGVFAENPNGLKFLKGNTRKFEESFGAVRLTPLTQSLQETIDWYHHARS